MIPKQRRKPVQREAIEQRNGVQLLESLGAKVYVLGTHRPRGRKCECGRFVAEHQGTCQTEGISDVQFFIPRRRASRHDVRGYNALDVRVDDGWRFCVWEAKSPDASKTRDGGMRPEQVEFRDLAIAAGVPHILGTFDALIAWLVTEGYCKTHQFPHYRVQGLKDAERPAELIVSS